MDEIADNLWFSTDCRDTQSRDAYIPRLCGHFIIKAQSSVFADLFSPPQPCESADMETMEGHPVITLHDKAADVEVFLKAIFDSRPASFMPPPSEIQFEDALAILRLSHKYDVGYLRRRALQHLGPIHPTTLAEYDGRPGTATLNRLRYYLYSSDEHPQSRHQKSVHHGFSQWCIMIYASGILPVSSPRAQVGTISAKRTQPQSTYVPKLTKILSVAKAAGDACDNWETCNIKRLKLNFAIDVSHLMRFPLDLWTEDHIWGTMRAFGLCNRCVAEIKSLHAAARQELWDRLPQMFGLPRWEELEKLKREALAV
ncbi:hypothetical protein B0H14DRAFT_3773705 [Mycena olivaceomarginata]|nr:hypothetical protein B0H14DRAFT_3773705 [Mycena olivaceomarginata]